MATCPQGPAPAGEMTPEEQETAEREATYILAPDRLGAVRNDAALRVARWALALAARLKAPLPAEVAQDYEACRVALVGSSRVDDALARLRDGASQFHESIAINADLARRLVAAESEAAARVRRLETWQDLMLDALGQGLDYTPTANGAAGVLRGIIADAAAAEQRAVTAESERDAALKREEAVSDHLQMMGVSSMETLSDDFARIQKERDAARQEVADLTRCLRDGDVRADGLKVMADAASAQVSALSARVAELDRDLSLEREAADGTTAGEWRAKVMAADALAAQASQEAEQAEARATAATQEAERLGALVSSHERALFTIRAAAGVPDGVVIAAHVSNLREQVTTLEQRVDELTRWIEKERNPRCQRQECARERAQVDALEAKLKAARTDLLADLRRVDEVLCTGGCVGECLTPQGEEAVRHARRLWERARSAPPPVPPATPADVLWRAAWDARAHLHNGRAGDAIGKLTQALEGTTAPAVLALAQPAPEVRWRGGRLRVVKPATLPPRLEVYDGPDGEQPEWYVPGLAQVDGAALRALVNELVHALAAYEGTPEPSVTHAQLAAAVAQVKKNPTGNAGVHYVDCCCDALDEVLCRVTGGQVPPVAEWQEKAAKWDAAVGRAKDAGMLRRTAWAAFIGVSVCDEAVEADVRERGAEGALSGVAPAVTNYVLGLTLPTPTPEGPALAPMNPLEVFTPLPPAEAADFHAVMCPGCENCPAELSAPESRFSLVDPDEDTANGKTTGFDDRLAAPEVAPAKPDRKNTCEHGDHPAPAGQRFCSPGCDACDSADQDGDDCAGLCGRDGDESAPAVLLDEGGVTVYADGTHRGGEGISNLLTEAQASILARALATALKERAEYADTAGRALVMAVHEAAEMGAADMRRRAEEAVLWNPMLDEQETRGGVAGRIRALPLLPFGEAPSRG